MERQAVLSAGELYRELYKAYGRPPWWSPDPFTVMFQAVLVQNTAWSSVQKACAALGEVPSAQAVLALPVEEVENMARPCGFYKAKARAIRALAAWYGGYGFERRAVQAQPLKKLRGELLNIKGVGAETADVILLYAFYQPVFVVDAYTRRLLQRLGGGFADDAAVRAYFAATLPAEPALCGALHWLLLEHAIAACRKRPACAACPLRAHCPAAENVFYE